MLVAPREVKPPISSRDSVKEFAKVLQAYGVSSIAGDRYAGEWPREAFRQYGIYYDVAEHSKSELYRELLPMLNSQTAVLLDQSRLIAQLCGLERRTARGGRDSIDHAPGLHDDVANAAAGALVRAFAASRVKTQIWFTDLPASPRELLARIPGLTPSQAAEASMIQQRIALLPVMPRMPGTCAECRHFQETVGRCGPTGVLTQATMPTCDLFEQLDEPDGPLPRGPFPLLIHP